jgi:hypothetical protein
MKKYLRKEFIIPIVYLLIFGICTYFASDFTPENINWFFATIFLTLPWSIATTFFVMGGLHLGDDQGVIVVMSIPAIINAYLLFLISKPKKPKQG